MGNTLLAIWMSVFGFAVQSKQTVTTKFENIEFAIIREFGPDCETALAVAKAEHAGRIKTNAVNSTEVEYSVGVFQINLAADFGNGKRVHWNKTPGNSLEEKSDWLKNFQNNISLAKKIQEKTGWAAWSTYQNGKYKKYLNSGCQEFSEGDN